MGLKPLARVPDGKRLDSVKCPIARGLSNDHFVTVGPTRAVIIYGDAYTNMKSLPLPRSARVFLAMHDFGLHPIRAIRRRPLKFKS